jgi:lipoprotein NlpD
MNGKPTGTYTVRRGDTLYGIAWRYRLNYRQLGAWNNIAGPEYVIYPGQRLRLEPPTTRKRPMARPPAKPRTKVVNDQPSAVPDSKLQTHAKTRQPLEPQSNSAAKQQPQKLKLAWRWPTKGKVVQTFSSHDPERKGVRISGVSGQPVVAAEAGRVVYSGSGLVGYGNLVIIKHGGDYLTAYGYNKQLLVNEGDNVARGERIAVMGAPRNGADSMLHFEIRKQGRPIDPLPLLPRL